MDANASGVSAFYTPIVATMSGMPAVCRFVKPYAVGPGPAGPTAQGSNAVMTAAAGRVVNALEENCALGVEHAACLIVKAMNVGWTDVGELAGLRHMGMRASAKSVPSASMGGVSLIAIRSVRAPSAGTWEGACAVGHVAVAARDKFA